MRFVTLVLFILSPPAMLAAADPLQTSRQCLVVVAPDWNATTGVLTAFERKSSRGYWERNGSPIRVMLGKKGLAWGRGLPVVKTTTGSHKVEGDNKAPAGIFRLGPAFGYEAASTARWIKLRYVPITKQTEGIDDPRSRYYNELVDRSKVEKIDWRSSEQMLRVDNLYKWGVLVAHNPTRTPGAGSCIFLHIWKNSDTATTGCTAMAERDLVALLRWLDPAARPLLVQMPRQQYEAARAKFRLPVAR